MFRSASLILLLLVIGAPAHSDTYKIDWYSINSGGGLASGGSYSINGSVGQSATGFVQSADLLHWIGFWAGEVPTPTIVPTVGEAKQLANGRFVCLRGKIATTGRDPLTTLNDRFISSRIYLEDADRSSGIRVAVPAAVAGLMRGNIVTAIGPMDTTPEGERQIAAAIVLITGTAPTMVTPVGMNNLSLGGGPFGTPPLGQIGVTGGVGLNNLGVLVRVWGGIAFKDANYMLISDGTGAPIKVDIAGLGGVPSSGFVTVIGISSIQADHSPLVLPRADSDIH